MTADLRAQVVLSCDDLEATIDWFVEVCGFQLSLISPADAPSTAVLDGHGLRLRLDTSAPAGPSRLLIPLRADEPLRSSVTAPNGTTVEWVAADPPLELPANQPEFVLSRAADGDWGVGRAGMQYRDLIPQRQGGRFIASHISIPTGGPVPDYVHHHQIRFQMIFCHTGWAQLVYEDQGPPFRFVAGDCVLQPPHIRHQVLETSDEFEVVEIGCPATHDTIRDHDMVLPTGSVNPDRDFGGQRFVHHRAASAASSPWRFDGFTMTSFGIDDATDGMAEVGIINAQSTANLSDFCHNDEFVFWFVRTGTAELSCNGIAHRIGDRDSVVLAAGDTHDLAHISEDFEFLEVRLR